MLHTNCLPLYKENHFQEVPSSPLNEELVINELRKKYLEIKNEERIERELKEKKRKEEKEKISRGMAIPVVYLLT
jgi:hypothetical protein